MDKKYIELAVDNISKYGDTDIFPFPIEKLIFHDLRDEVIAHIQDIDNKFYDYLSKNPPINISTSTPLGYTGFRWATQIDPFWNAYFLACILSVSEQIEETRIKKEQNVVYSYRYNPNNTDHSLFDIEYNWLKFQKDSLDFVKQNESYKYIVSCDIADFYNRIYHHPLENCLDRLDPNNETPKKIKKIIQKFSNTKSYGLPIGGQGARILAELVLNNTDRLLISNSYKFKRFVDDYYIFCETLEEAHSALNFIANKLMKNEGLSLQKHKTIVQSRNDFEKLVSSRVNADSDNVQEVNRAKFMSLPINYDPYSDTAEADYLKIKSELEEFDIVGLLNDELKKVRIHQQFGKRLIKSFDILEPEIISNAFISICEKFDILYPIFPTIMTSAYKNFDKLNSIAVNLLLRTLRGLVKSESYIVQSELHMAYLLRVLGLRNSAENEETVIFAYNKNSESILIRSIVIQVMTRWKAYHWLSDKKDNFTTMNKWERRLFIISSCFLGDEGIHWQNHNKSFFSESEKIIQQWAKEKSKLTNWELPL